MDYLLVYVINKYNKPLMPCKSSKARKLLKQGKAKVIKRTPFTIQLLYGSSGYKQEINLGVDAGTKHIGLSATTKEKVLFEADMQLRIDIVNLLTTRKQNRRLRRNRKIRYRKARFLNRKKKKGWLAPSIQHKVDSHVKIINFTYKILPVSKIIIELASFDIQKIKNQDISGKEYQQGEQLDFWNVREYVLFRDNHTCQHCKGKSKDKILQVHHKESRKTGGNSPDNLITVCKTCHENHHNGKIIFNFKRNKSFRDASHINIMRWFLFNQLKEIYPNIIMTYGYITKYIRIQNNLQKEHRIDALCISGNPTVKRLNYWYFIKKVRCHNRQIHKANILKGGVKKLNQAQFEVKGFRLFDKIQYQDKLYYIFSRRNSGFFDIRTLDGTKINKGSVNCKSFKLIEKRKSLLIERRTAFLPNLKT